MRSVDICLDSGLRATDACYDDARGINRVVSVMCYPEDIPDGTCNKHVSVHYCVDGGGVANEFCSLYGDANVQTRSLVRLTPAEIREIKDAASSGLVDAYLDAGYVYYVDENGDELAWAGFYGNADGAEGLPYLVCTIHTDYIQEDFEDLPGGDWGDGDHSGDGFGGDNGHFGDHGGEDFSDGGDFF